MEKHFVFFKTGFELWTHHPLLSSSVYIRPFYFLVLITNDFSHFLYKNPILGVYVIVFLTVLHIGELVSVHELPL